MSSDEEKYQIIRKELGNAMQELSTVTILFHQKIAQKLNLNPTDHKCLYLIMKNGHLTAGQLANLTGLTTGAITGVIDRLEGKKLVRREKDPNDRRKIIVVANQEKAMKVVSPLFASLESVMDKLYCEYSEEELQTILGFINKSVKIMYQEIKK